jgi:predicted ATPase
VTRLVVVSGGPGAGKTTLLDELVRMGHPYVPESARPIIQDRRSRGLLPRPEPHEFATEILRRDIEKYRGARTDAGVLFFDGGILGALGMLDQIGRLPAPERDRYLTEYPYHRQVFLLPPWEAIYRIDSERDQTFPQSVRVHDALREWYLRCGYEIVSVPPGPVADRCDFVLQTLDVR